MPGGELEGGQAACWCSLVLLHGLLAPLAHTVTAGSCYHPFRLPGSHDDQPVHGLPAVPAVELAVERFAVEEPLQRTLFVTGRL